ncbi:multidrug efflux SMR transporter [Paenibacillus spiritus]|uniref:Multidrug efflux SMR transporter n=1 Tax=Paenibacillus spiritus TaxID=2496557 RepID=A0A5J5GBT9_9BACL|nr:MULTISPECIES: multidrug efflux SMR transporter [Paenibacillus]KAA9005488.1 multidrug efflux SMR transporter [Paenibacillus spiritus]
MNRNWLYVLVGGLVEVFWVSGLKHASTAAEWALTAAAIAASFWLIIRASSRLPVGTVYAVFTGLGTAGSAVAEVWFFGEPFRLSKMLLTAVLLAGIIGLKLLTDQPAGEGGRS